MQTVKNYTINQSSLQELSNGVNNPFDQLAKMFEQTPLVRINTVDVPVNIPMIYAEDIAKYESYLKTRIERNKQIIKDWETLLQWTLWICGKDYSLTSTTSQPNTTPILNQEFLNNLSQKLKTEKEKFTDMNTKLEECKSDGRKPSNSSCQMMNTFGVSWPNLPTVEQSA